MRYYPLIDIDDSGQYKQPMFASEKERVVRSCHRYYLAEESRGKYRLHAREAHQMRDYIGFHIRCPKCGKEMQIDDIHVNDHILARYICGYCGA